MPRDATATTTVKEPGAFRSIGEAAAEVGLQTHVLRFWETKFRELSPVKRRDGRRFYRAEDVQVLRAIQMLLHDRGMTIKGAQKMIAEQGIEAILTGDARVVPLGLDAAAIASQSVESPARKLQETVRDAFDAAPADSVTEGVLSDASRQRLEGVLHDITDVKRRLDAIRMKRAA